MSVLVVQLGHCYRTTGATGTNGEQEFATRVGEAARRLLDGRGGWRVRLVLADDHRPASLAGDAFAAIHCDGSTNPTAAGMSVGYQTREGQRLGQAFKRAYLDRGWTGGFRPDNYTDALANYYGVREAFAAGTRAAVIVEAGFLTNPGNRLLLTATGPHDGADRVALAVADVLGIPINPTVPEEDPVRFIRGNAPAPWGDFVFKTMWPERAEPIAFRVHVPNDNDPGYRAAAATGAGMDPATGKPWVLDQSIVDELPFENDDARRRFDVFARAYLDTRTPRK